MSNPLFLVACVLFSIHQVIEKILCHPIPLLDNYLDTLLCMPIFLGCLLIERRWLYKKPNFTFTAFEVGFMLIVLSIIFEIVFPWLSPNFTADWWDVLLYAVGGIVFYRFINLDSHSC